MEDIGLMEERRGSGLPEPSLIGISSSENCYFTRFQDYSVHTDVQKLNFITRIELKRGKPNMEVGRVLGFNERGTTANHSSHTHIPSAAQSSLRPPRLRWPFVDFTTLPRTHHPKV
ncbi:hypothetical protein EVAR_14406_1 [Eumeta japonica]|uniref:Uncharacterized protein n=1 Tax=Eumeta variegata TaxID=151549 RepID=A0A4C1TYG4_EUMVA|nr:hypothetical protein EVAR_14406_1 [Eumeta japonica]